MRAFAWFFSGLFVSTLHLTGRELTFPLSMYRLGLGASVTKFHIQQAEDKKLRDKLLSNGGHIGVSKKRLREEEEELKKRQREKGSFESASEEEGESRSNAIGKKGKSILKVNNKEPLEKLQRPLKSSKKQSLTQLDTPSSNTTSSSTALSSTLSHTNSKLLTTSSSFAAISSTSTSAGGMSTPLTKNQKKKERDKLKIQMAKKAKMLESRAEDEATKSGKNTEVEGEDEDSEMPDIDNSISTEPSRESSLSRKLDLISKHEVTSPRDQTVLDVLKNGAVERISPEKEGDDDEDEDGSGDEHKTADMNGGQDGEGKKKKRRRKKKKSSGGAVANVNGGVLNLVARAP